MKFQLLNLKQQSLQLIYAICLVMFLLHTSAVIANDKTKIIPSSNTGILTTSNTSSSFLNYQNKPRVSVDEVCRKLARKLGSVRLGDCLGRGFEDSGGRSVKGLPIIVKEFGELSRREPLSKVLLIGGIHGDEYSSVSMVFKWMKILERNHSGMFHWKMVPVMNPDGLLQKKSQRMNSNGVDLNRNFPTPNWEAETHKYWMKTSRNPRRYPGPAPLSEPESQWLAKYIADFKPDVIVSIHAPFGILDFDGPRKAPERFGQLQLNLLGTYPGSLGNYAGVNKQIPVVTIELPYAGIMPKQKEISQIWMDLVKWLQNNAYERQQAIEENLNPQQPAMLERKSVAKQG